MKKCPWCGREYPDEVAVCAIDQNPLESSSSNPAPPAEALVKPQIDCAESSDLPSPKDEETEVPEGFRYLGGFDALEAGRLLRQFEDAGIRFQIDRVERRVPTIRGFRNMSLIEIYVHQDDDERAGKIFTADWKV
jgi:hypothetical protein